MVSRFAVLLIVLFRWPMNVLAWCPALGARNPLVGTVAVEEVVGEQGPIRGQEARLQSPRKAVCTLARWSRWQEFKTLNGLLNQRSMVYEFPSKPGLVPLHADEGRPIDAPPAEQNFDNYPNHGPAPGWVWKLV